MSIGRVAEFNLKTGNWTHYIERVEMYFKVNNMAQDLWLPTLIAAMGDETYELLSNLTSPTKPSDKTYAEVVTVLREHLHPEPSFMAERYRFRQRRQDAGESVSQYIMELKRLARYCEFDKVLEDNLRDQLVCGLRSDIIRQRLFAEGKLVYSSAVKIAIAMEAAERDSAAVELGSGSASSSAGGGGGGAASAVHALVSAARPRSQGRGSLARRQQGGGGRPSSTYCDACGERDHDSNECRFKRYVCGKCRQKGHLRRVCPKRNQKVSGRRDVHHVEAAAYAGARPGAGPPELSGEDEPPASEGSYSDVEEDLHQLCLNSYKPVSLTLVVDGIHLKMEVDTGSAVSCISKDTYERCFSARPIESFDLSLKFYDGSKIKPLGVIKPTVEYKDKTLALELFVIEGGTTTLLGRQWISELDIQIPTLHNCTEKNYSVKVSANDVSQLLDRYKELFTEELGRFTGGKARLHLRDGAVPIYCRARPIAYSLRQRIDTAIDDMLRTGVLEPVSSSDWATPLVPVRKADGGLRICADYKVTLNPVLWIDRYPLPRIDDLLVSMNGAKVFSKIDLSQAYNQIELEDPDNLTVINTHRGLFKYKRLVYGLSSSPGIFQRIMANLLGDIPNVEIFLDDVIIGSSNEEEHLQTLARVLERFYKNGMKLKKSKCSFMVPEVKYLGYIISKDGIKVDPEKVEAITNIPRPKDVTDLRSFLGLVNFYARFVRSLSSILAPLHNLLKKEVDWKWDHECERAFTTIKSILTSAEVLAHYDANKSLILTCDASSRGIGGVLSQPTGVHGRERPVVYVSRALTSAEKHYSQIDREALAIVFCLEKLHQYLYGRQFTLRTDHKPLVSIFGPKYGIPAMAASRLQRWSVKLAAYTYDIEYINTKLNGADGLSRLPLPVKTGNSPQVPEQTFLHLAEDATLLDHTEIRKQTHGDSVLGRVVSYIRDGWPAVNEIKAFQPYFNRQKELYEELGIVMWGHRVVIPSRCTDKVLKELHESHMGIVKTKAIARSYAWWPGIDEAIEAMCRSCAVCACEADAPPRHAVSPWPWPTRAWSRVHADFLGPLFGKLYLIIIDARTKWLEVFPVASTAASHLISKLSEVFGRWGVPKQFVSDNGPPFTSKEVAGYLVSNGVEHLFSAPYHPASNGAAENAVKTVKRVIKKAVRQNVDISLYLNNFLLHYRNTEHSTTGESPASLMLGRHLRTKLDALKPDREVRVRNAQKRQQDAGPSAERELITGDSVWLRQYSGGDRWLPGKVIERLGTTDYKVMEDSGRESHRHIDQIRHRLRSSLIGPSSQPETQPHQGQVTSESLPAAGAPACPSPSSGDKRDLSARDYMSEIVDPPPAELIEQTPTPGPSSGTAAPCPPAEPTQSRPTRPIRSCRLKNPPNYKV